LGLLVDVIRGRALYYYATFLLPDVGDVITVGKAFETWGSAPDPAPGGGPFFSFFACINESTKLL